ncbi:MAG TPA: biotin/lipoate A/B protein ligase family protein [Longimicrobiales bacterium]
MNLSNSESWRFLDDEVAVRNGVANMAVDHTLLESVQTGSAPILRFYRWSEPTLSLGRNQPAARSDAAVPGRGLVRRPTGGMAVLHHREITYAIALPAGRLGGPRATYVTVNRALVAGLRALGVAASVSPRAPRSHFGSVHPCFAEAAEGEVVAHGKKLVGSAQRYERRAILQHGSILLGNDQPTGAISLAELLPELPPVNEIARIFSASFAQLCGICLAPAELSRREIDRAEELEELYASEAWTWRR